MESQQQTQTPNFPRPSQQNPIQPSHPVETIQPIQIPSQKPASSIENQNINCNPEEQEYKNPQITQNDQEYINYPVDSNHMEINDQNVAADSQKMRRHRRSKNDVEGRNHQCEFCGKCYLSAPALTNHKKTKHADNADLVIKGRGRPKKEQNPTTVLQAADDKFHQFFRNELRRRKIVDSNSNINVNVTGGQNQAQTTNQGNNTEQEPDITVDNIKQLFNNLFNELKLDLWVHLDKVENYELYKIMINNWDLEKPELKEESLCSSLNKQTQNQSVKSPPLDYVFFIYLKSMSKEANNKYFNYLFKFIVLMREGINYLKKESMISEQGGSEIKKEFTMVYNADIVSDLCNDFFNEFLDKYGSYGLDYNELIEITQHFCYWLFRQRYSHSHLVLLNDNAGDTNTNATNNF